MIHNEGGGINSPSLINYFSSKQHNMEPEDILNIDPLLDLIESEDYDEIEYDDLTFGAMLDSSNDF